MKLKRIAANLTELFYKSGDRVLVSYTTPVAHLRPDGTALVTDVKHSRTTSRHINRWLGDVPEVRRETRPQAYFDDLLESGVSADEPETVEADHDEHDADPFDL